METDSPRLVGFEIDRRLVRAIVLSSDGTDILAYADSSVMEPGTHDDAFPNPGPAISSIWHKLQLAQYKSLRVAASFGFRHAGIGSGDSMAGWVDAMTAQLDEPIAVVPHGDGGISYAPKTHIEIVREGFQWVGCELDAIELAPISAARTLAFQPSGVLRIGSGVAWQVRIHNGSVLEALPYSGGVTRSGVYVEFFGQDEEALPAIHGVDVPVELLESQQLTVGTLAVTVGAALGLRDSESVGNFCPHLEKSESLVGTAQVWTTDPTSNDDRPLTAEPDVNIDLTSPEGSTAPTSAGPSFGLVDRIDPDQAVADSSERNIDSSSGIDAGATKPEDDAESVDPSDPIDPAGNHEEEQRLDDADADSVEAAGIESENLVESDVVQSDPDVGPSASAESQSSELAEPDEVESEVAELVGSDQSEVVDGGGLSDVGVGSESDVDVEVVGGGELSDVGVGSESDVEVVDGGELSDVGVGSESDADADADVDVVEVVDGGGLSDVEAGSEPMEAEVEPEGVTDDVSAVEGALESEISTEGELDSIETEGDNSALDEPDHQPVDEVDSFAGTSPLEAASADLDGVQGDGGIHVADVDTEGADEVGATADGEHPVVDLDASEASGSGADEPSGEDSGAGSDEAVIEADESDSVGSNGPPMPDENFAHAPVDASTTATMAAIPPPISVQQFQPDAQPTSNGNGALPTGGQESDGGPKQNLQVPLAAWSNDEFHGKTETAHEVADPESELSQPPADPIETQPVPPLDGIRINPSVDDVPTADVASTEWQPFGPPQVRRTEIDQSPGLVQPRYADEGIDRGIESPNPADLNGADGVGSDDIRDTVTIEPSAGLRAKMPPAPTPSIDSNDTVLPERFAGLAPQGEETQPRYDSPGLETGNLALSKPVIHGETAERTVTGAVPVEKAAAHLEAQLDAEDAEMAPPPPSEVRSIQQPGPRREVKRSRRLWPILVLSLVFLVAVAAVLYVWQIGL